MTREEIQDRLKQQEVDYILVQYVDIHGTPRCKGVPVRAFDQLLAGSAGFAGAAVHGMGQGPHDHDMIALPDLASYTPVPWEEGVVRFACDIQVDGQEWPYCSRTALRRAVAELASAAVGWDVSHRGVLRLHLDACLHQLWGLQPYPDVQGTGAGTL